MIRPVVGTVAWAVSEVWFAAVAVLDRCLAYFPRRWNP